MKKVKKPKSIMKVPEIIGYKEVEMEHDCPIRGKVKEKIKIKIYATAETRVIQVVGTSSIIEKIEDSE